MSGSRFLSAALETLCLQGMQLHPRLVANNLAAISLAACTIVQADCNRSNRGLFMYDVSQKWRGPDPPAPCQPKSEIGLPPI